MKYMCNELGTNMEGNSVIKGTHTYGDLLKCLDKFISKYVLCKNCNYPELMYHLEGKNDFCSKCNACSAKNTHDSLSAAGKAMLQHIKTGATVNADIDKKKKKGKGDLDLSDDENKKKDKKKKKAKEEDEVSEEEQKEEEKEDISDVEDEFTYNSRRILKVVEKIKALSSEEMKSNDKVLDVIEEYKEKYKIPSEYLHLIALSGLFSPKRSPVKNWPVNEDTFIALAKSEGNIGKDHLLQSIALFFIKIQSGLDKYAGTFLKKLVDENIFTDKFIIQWFDKDIKLDKESGLYDKKSERKLRELSSVEKFVEWLKDADSDSGSSSGEEEKEENDGNQENEAMKQQRILIEK